MAGAGPTRFQFTGSLLPTSLYIRRDVDTRLLETLCAGKFCHVVAPRQIGKSSLRASTTRALHERGFRCVSFDLTALGTPGTADEWYFSLAAEVAEQLGHPDAREFWDARGGVTPALRWRDFLRNTLRREPGRQIVVLLDEIESVKLVDFPIDDFFPTLRSISEARASDPDLARLTVCLTGVTSPSDLIDDRDRTPYSISEPIEIADFTRAELDGLLPGFAGLDVDAAALIDAIHGWTAGHPYMTMKICAKLVEGPAPIRRQEQAAVDRVVHEQFLLNYLRDPNLSYAARRFDDPKYAQRGASLADKIELYRKIQGGEAVVASRRSELQVELMLCGMVAIVEQGGEAWLRPRNRVFEVVFDGAWLRARGQRRYLGEAIWAWLDSGKDPSALLRGKLLEDAVAWSHTMTPSNEEEEFLTASLDQQRVEMEARRVEIKGEVDRIEAKRAASEAAYHAQVARAKRLLALLLVFVPTLTIAVVWGATYIIRERTAVLGALTAELGQTVTTLTDEKERAQTDLNVVTARLRESERQSETAAREFAAMETAQQETLASLDAKVKQEQTLLRDVTDSQDSLSQQGKQLLACKRDVRRAGAELTTCLDKWQRCENKHSTYRSRDGIYQDMLASRSAALRSCKAMLATYSAQQDLSDRGGD